MFTRRTSQKDDLSSPASFESWPARLTTVGTTSLILLSAILLQPFASLMETKTAKAAENPSAFRYHFSVPGTLWEAGNMIYTTSPYWWVNSGAALVLENGVGKTLQGTLLPWNRFSQLYKQSNPRDTDSGTHPQNIFRLVTLTDHWQNFRQELSFRINKINVSESSYRNGSNGVLLFNRYVDGNNLYYTGIRVDGKAVIKKKKDGKYTTLAYEPLFSGSYNRNSNPNLIPEDKWMRIRSTIQNNANGSVTIRVYLDEDHNGSWKLVAEAVDANDPITTSGRAGIRTDFADVEFDEFHAISL